MPRSVVASSGHSDSHRKLRSNLVYANEIKQLPGWLVRSLQRTQLLAFRSQEAVANLCPEAPQAPADT